MNYCIISGCREPAYDGDPYQLCHHHTSRVRIWDCGDDHRYLDRCYAAVASNGMRRCVQICDDCGHLLHNGVAKCDNNQQHKVVTDSRNHWDVPPCERCGDRTGVELHHWAPSALFDDADEWPQSYLCVGCHQLWHHITRTNRRQEAA